MKREYLILLIVVIAGLIAIFSLTFIMGGQQENLTGAVWGKPGNEYYCEGYTGAVDEPMNERDCKNSGGEWKKRPKSK